MAEYEHLLRSARLCRSEVSAQPFRRGVVIVACRIGVNDSNVTALHIERVRQPALIGFDSILIDAQDNWTCSSPADWPHHLFPASRVHDYIAHVCAPCVFVRNRSYLFAVRQLVLRFVVAWNRNDISARLIQIRYGSAPEAILLCQYIDVGISRITHDHISVEYEQVVFRVLHFLRNPIQSFRILLPIGVLSIQFSCFVSSPRESPTVANVRTTRSVWDSPSACTFAGEPTPGIMEANREEARITAPAFAEILLLDFIWAVSFLFAIKIGEHRYRVDRSFSSGRSSRQSP